MAKQIIYKDEARMKLKAGVDALAEAVGATMGALGKNVALDKSWGTPIVTHDGVTVAKEVELEDKFENMGAKLVLEAATKTNDTAGDGTTTATVLAQALVESGLRNISSGINPMSIRSGMESGRDKLIEAIKGLAKPIKTKEEKINIATNSSQDPLVGREIAEAMEKVGDDGVIAVEEGKGMRIEVETKEGMNFDNGYLSNYLVTNEEKMVAELENPYLLLTDKKIGSIQELIPLLNKVSGQGLVIIADDIEAQTLATLVLNKMRGSLKVLAVKAPGFGDRRKAMLGDIAVVTGGTVISEDLGRKLESVEVEDLGRADKVISTKDDTTIVGGLGDKSGIETRIGQIRQEMVNASAFDKDRLQERLAKLSGGVAVIYVGGATEGEMKEKKYRVEDAVNATQAAISEGVVVGGGVSLLKIRKTLDLNNMGERVLYEALEKPFRRILFNAGVEAGAYLQQIEKSEGNIGYNVLSGKLEDLLVAGIIDPAKVTKSAIENAVSVAITILTTEVLIADIEPPKETSVT